MRQKRRRKKWGFEIKPVKIFAGSTYMEDRTVRLRKKLTGKDSSFPSRKSLNETILECYYQHWIISLKNIIMIIFASKNSHGQQRRRVRQQVLWQGFKVWSTQIPARWEGHILKSITTKRKRERSAWFNENNNTINKIFELQMCQWLQIGKSWSRDSLETVVRQDSSNGE